MLTELEKSLIKKEETFCSNTYHPLPVVLKKGKGVYVWDIHDKNSIQTSFPTFLNIINDLKNSPKNHEKPI